MKLRPGWRERMIARRDLQTEEGRRSFMFAMTLFSVITVLTATSLCVASYLLPYINAFAGSKP